MTTNEKETQKPAPRAQAADAGPEESSRPGGNQPPPEAGETDRPAADAVIDTSALRSGNKNDPTDVGGGETAAQPGWPARSGRQGKRRRARKSAGWNGGRRRRKQKPWMPRDVPLYSQPAILPNSDGSFVIRPGPPVQKLTTEEFGRYFNVMSRTVCRWIKEGVIDAKHVELVGRRRLFIRAEAVKECAKKFETLRE